MASNTTWSKRFGELPTILFVTPFVPSAVGHGGTHRSYQIFHDAELIVGKEHLRLISFAQWRNSRRTHTLLDFVRRARRRVADYLENPYKFLVFTHYSARGYDYSDFCAYYEECIREIPKPIVCIIEHTSFSSVIRINSHYGIPTISCIQNLESLDSSALYYESRGKWASYARSIDFNNEFRVLAQCTERLFISKVEAGLISGLGLPSHYYPYLPVGAIHQRLQWIRQERAKGYIEPGLFLMLGSTGHYTTKSSFLWFIQNAQTHGLPNGVRVVIVGDQTRETLSSGSLVPEIELRGWLDQDEFDHLLIQACAVLAPQRLGFGALTRLPELSCAGIPVVTNSHPIYAINPPPGLAVLDDHWLSWYNKIEELMAQPYSFGGEYNAWAESQPKTLESTIKNLLKDL